MKAVRDGEALFEGSSGRVVAAVMESGMWCIVCGSIRRRAESLRGARAFLWTTWTSPPAGSAATSIPKGVQVFVPQRLQLRMSFDTNGRSRRKPGIRLDLAIAQREPRARRIDPGYRSPATRQVRYDDRRRLAGTRGVRGGSGRDCGEHRIEKREEVLQDRILRRQFGEPHDDSPARLKGLARFRVVILRAID
jgi:hypothetical protein